MAVTKIHPIKPYSADYLRTIPAQLTAIFNHAVNFYNLPYNPARRAGTIGNEAVKEMDFWTKEEYLKFSEAMMDKPRSYYAFEMLYWCGMRSGELLALTPADIDFEKQTVTISKTFHRSKGRDIITSPKTKKSKHLSVLDFEKQERQKEVAELEQTIFGSKEELSNILHQQIAVGRETEQIRKEGEAIRQEVSELSVTNHFLKEQRETLTEDKEKLLSENEKLEKQQKKLQQELNKMVQSKEIMERNIHAYDEDVKWQLAEPGALMSAKAYRDKKALPLVEKLKEVVKNLTIKCVQLTEQSKKLTAKMDGQQKQISRLTDKVMEQSDTIDRLQEKASDLGRLERHLGREQVQLIVERSKVLEQAERANKRSKRAFEMSR